MFKVWNGTTDGKNHCLVVAKNQKRAVELLRIFDGSNMSVSYFRRYWSCAGGKWEKQLIEDKKECVWIWEENHNNDEKDAKKFYVEE